MPIPTVILPGYLAGAEEYQALEQAIREQHGPAAIVPLRWWDWLVTVGGRPVTPVLELLEQTVDQALAVNQAQQVNLVAHSAGGWIARMYLGEQAYCGRVWGRHPKVATLITLGTPHRSLERWTRTNLDFVNDNYPGAFHPQVRYVCIAGKAVEGKPGWHDNWLAYQSYKLTAGKGETWGDAITPIAAAHLEGAENITLPDVLHSPRGGRYWYGSPDALQQWLPYLQ
ncbi:triacylglycerol lipase [Leptolyngbya sp. FACHB-261]|uniref:esterase/lipase family protein n=1 Tax=Leptolyngbya sp. FACHB-261 TaxID=2692806 RepID=UPI0016844649|nr:lipase [Leptolyngbya sp. FACHB-261]MBD2100561.1 lipase [Leptolyngbya sp. FACHB-261]